MSENIKNNISAFTLFLEGIKDDYKNSDVQLQSALNKFAECYIVAKLKSIPRLASFLYNIDHNLDPTVNIRSGSMIRVQVESVKWRKTEGSGRKRKLPVNIKEKENSDSQSIPSQKKRRTSKKDHKLSENILKISRIEGLFFTIEFIHFF